MKILNTGIILGILTAATLSQASPVCSSVDDCKSVIQSAKIKMQELLNSNGQIMTNSGAVFTHDLSTAELGDAYKDPSGVIWGQALRQNGQLIYASQSEASELCKRVGLRLPTKKEIEKLATYLGEGAQQGYSVFTADKTSEVLPGFKDHPIWSSAKESADSPFAYGIGHRPNPRNAVSFVDLEKGSPVFLIESRHEFNVRCVMKK